MQSIPIPRTHHQTSNTATRLLIWPLIVLLVSLLTLPANAQKKMPTDPYTARWKTVDSLANKGLYQSALEAVQRIFEQARQDGATGQLIKAAVYESNYLANLREDGAEQAIARFDSLTYSLPAGVARSVMQSLLAERYRNYLDRHRWQLQQRTPTTEADTATDLRSWTIERLQQRTTDLYLQSVQEPALRAQPLTEFAAIIEPGKSAEGLVPTLYDLLTRRAIQHFSDTRNFASEPAYRFSLTTAQGLAPLDAFIDLDFATPDTSSYTLRVVQLYQQLLAHRRQAWQQDAATLPALLDADLARLRFVYDHLATDDRHTAYEQALDRLYQQHRNQPAVGAVRVAQLKAMIERGGQYQPNANDGLRWLWRDAVALAESIQRDYSGTLWAKQAAAEVSGIKEPTVQLQVEQAISPGQAGLVSIRYRNVSRTYHRIIRLTEADYRLLADRFRDEDWANLLSRSPVQQWNTDLPQLGDYREHSTEAMHQPLAPGCYALFTSTNAKFSQQSAPLLVTLLWASDLALVDSENHTEAETEVMVVDRQTGAPQAGVAVSFWAYERYSRRTREWKQLNQATTDQQGMVRIKLPNNSYPSVRLMRGEQWLYSEQGVSNYYHNRDKTTQQRTAFFLDRAIYRPGQTVYYKGIVMSVDDQQRPSILRDQSVTVALIDGNGQEVASQQLRSNEYGTVNGSFVLPGGKLLGYYRLSSSVGDNDVSFRVEEYKRPRFEVVMDTLSGQPRLGDTVTATGQALAYAGPPLVDAQVRYRVVRRVQFPWWGWYRGGYEVPERTLAQGVTQTDAQGRFAIDFLAEPAEEKNDQWWRPLYLYEVSVDVVDMTGETHAAQKVIQLSKTPVLLTLEVPDASDRAEAVTISLGATNLESRPLAVSGTLLVTALQAPEQIYVERYWEVPDTLLLSVADYRQHFPRIALNEENEPRNWPTGREVLRRQVTTTDGQHTITLDPATLAVGHYRIQFSVVTEQGDTVTQQAILAVYDAAAGQAPAGELLRVDVPTEPLQPGEVLRVPLLTSAGTTHLRTRWHRSTDPTPAQWVAVSPATSITTTVTEGDRGGLELQLVYVRYNRFYSARYPVQVPWTNKELQISYQTFRDRLRPGQDETWIIKIEGPQQERFSAELAASMYDASLDQFVPHNWQLDLWPTLGYNPQTWRGDRFGAAYANQVNNYYYRRPDYPTIIYPSIISLIAQDESVQMRQGLSTSVANAPPAPVMAEMEQESAADASGNVAYGKVTDGADTVTETAAVAVEPVSPRTNLQETAFFLPELRTDAEGRVEIRFRTPEALTRWKLQLLATTPDLRVALEQRTVETYKDLMILPNAPRFLREGDDVELTARISNLSDRSLAGTATLQLTDLSTGDDLNQQYQLGTGTASFSVAADGSEVVSWRVQVPKNAAGALGYQVTARSGDFSDAEANSLPVLTNRVLVTETQPIHVRGQETKKLTLRPLASANSPTLTHQSFTLEMTSNPAWLAIKSLPYLMEYPYDCTEQVVNRWVANTLASSVVQQTPRLRAVFDSWKADPRALQSPLAVNEELKSALLAETPWVMEAQDEAQQRERIALLFDLDRMAREQREALATLTERQQSDGSFAWFPGGRSNRYMTQYVAEAIGHLHQLGAINLEQDQTARALLEEAFRYLDDALLEDYEELSRAVNRGKAKWEDDHLSATQLHYLYVRSRQGRPQWTDNTQRAWDYYLGQAAQYWLQRGLYDQGLAALALHASGKPASANDILASLRERAIRNEELGMYWKYPRSYYWNELPIETHSLLIEVFRKLGGTSTELDDLRIWLLKNKETNRWQTTKATAAAVYALLSAGTNWLGDNPTVQISLPQLKRRAYADQLESAQASAEAGTGYFRVQWPAAQVSPAMAEVEVRNSNENVAYGGMYWQYLEDIDRVPAQTDTPLQLERMFYRRENSDAGQRLVPLAAGTALQPGDRLTVRLTVRTDRDMEYVHLKDLRASGLEPVDVLSGYQYQDGLGYYFSPTDVGANFFFDYLPRGVYVLEYDLFVVHRGNFSNGLATLQCMYAPAFSSHSAGSELSVSKQ